MTGEKILVVEDEQNILEAIKYSMNAEGFEGYGAEDGEIPTPNITSNKITLVFAVPKIFILNICVICHI